MKVIGLTGGVGSGKSLVAQKMEEELGAVLLIADELGRAAMEPGTDSFERIVRRFGEELVLPDGTLDRNRLAGIIFQDAAARRAVNEIIHPVVKACMAQEISRRKNEEGLLVLETAILFESGCDALCDEIWYVRVPASLRQKRLQESRGYSPEKSQAIMAGQLEEQEFLRRCDKVLENDSTPQALSGKIRSLLA